MIKTKIKKRWGSIREFAKEIGEDPQDVYRITSQNLGKYESPNTKFGILRNKIIRKLEDSK